MHGGGLIIRGPDIHGKPLGAVFSISSSQLTTLKLCHRQLEPDLTTPLHTGNPSPLGYWVVWTLHSKLRGVDRVTVHSTLETFRIDSVGAECSQHLPDSS